MMRPALRCLERVLTSSLCGSKDVILPWQERPIAVSYEDYTDEWRHLDAMLACTVGTVGATAIANSLSVQHRNAIDAISHPVHALLKKKQRLAATRKARLEADATHTADKTSARSQPHGTTTTTPVEDGARASREQSPAAGRRSEEGISGKPRRRTRKERHVAGSSNQCVHRI